MKAGYTIHSGAIHSKYEFIMCVNYPAINEVGFHYWNEEDLVNTEKKYIVARFINIRPKKAEIVQQVSN